MALIHTKKKKVHKIKKKKHTHTYILYDKEMIKKKTVLIKY